MRVAGSEEAVASSAAEGSVVAVGSGQPLKAFQVALKTMKEGEKTKLKIKPACELFLHRGAPLHACLEPCQLQHTHCAGRLTLRPEHEG